MNEDTRITICAAIVSQAIKDYKDALAKKDRGEIRRLEEWFLSDWGQTLSNDNGALIIEKTRKEFFNE